MNLESRVEALEHELKILKNEIQNTLLEIREELLNHYYPELRAEETSHAQGRPATAPRNGSGNTPRLTKAPRQPISKLFIQDDAVEAGFAENDFAENDLTENGFVDEAQGAPDDHAARMGDGAAIANHANGAPKLREVQYQQLKQAGATPHTKPKRSQPRAQRPARRPFAALAAWVGDSVAKVGKERTMQVVESYAATDGNLTDDTKGSLLQLIALASDVEPTAPPSNQAMLGLMVELDHLLAE